MSTHFRRMASDSWVSSASAQLRHDTEEQKEQGRSCVQDVSDDDYGDDVDEFVIDDTRDAWGAADPIQTERDSGEAAMIELTDHRGHVTPPRESYATAHSTGDDDAVAASTHSVQVEVGQRRPLVSAIRMLLQHRDNTVSKHQDDNKVMMGFLLIVILLLAVILWRIPATSSDGDDDDVFTAEQRDARDMLPWLLTEAQQHADPVLQEWDAYLCPNGTRSSVTLQLPSDRYRLRTLQRVSLDRTTAETAQPWTTSQTPDTQSRWFRLRDVQDNASASCMQTMDANSVSTNQTSNALGVSLWEWWRTEMPRISGATRADALDGSVQWTNRTNVWTMIAERHYRWCDSWLHDAQTARSLVMLTMAHLVWSEWIVPRFFPVQTTEAAAAISLMWLWEDLRDQWSRPEAKEWVRTVYTAMQPSREADAALFVPTIVTPEATTGTYDADDDDDDDPLLSIVNQFAATHPRWPTPSAMLLEFFAIFQLSAWQSRNHFLIAPQALLYAWTNQSRIVDSVDSLLALHVPMIHVWIARVTL
jgi:hypothetical protein